MKVSVYQFDKIKFRDKACNLCWVKAIFIP